MREAEHTFGGDWTEQKLDALFYYLQFYTTALKGKADASWSFDLWYVDAFAGSGERTAARQTGGLFVQQPIGHEVVQLDGSAKRALAIKPPFQRVVLIEADPTRYAALCALRDDSRVQCIHGDANEELAKLLKSAEWRLPGAGKGLRRGVVFLDPYGMQVSWQTLELLAATKRFDVWYLFPIEAVGRQLARSFEGVDQAKQRKLDFIFGGPEWQTDLYQDEVIAGDLFFEATTQRRRGNRRDIEAYVQRRLKELFPFVSEPLSIGPGNQQKFALFLLVSNDSPKAIGLAKKAVSDLIRRQKLEASRQRSAP